MKGMTTCKVCGRDFPLIAEEHYVARNVEKVGLIPAISGQEETEDHDGCFGCLHEDVETGEYPCNECKGSYTDKWERKGDSEK